MQYLPTISGIVVGFLATVFCNLTGLGRQQVMSDAALATLLCTTGGLATAASSKVLKEQERFSKKRKISQHDLEQAMAHIERAALEQGSSGIEIATALRELHNRLGL